jgi:hypothetical protein
MITRILSPFHDKYNYGKSYAAGDIVTFDDARAAELIAKGLIAEVVEEKAAETKAVATETKKKKKDTSDVKE